MAPAQRKHVAVGLFLSRADMENAVDALKTAGFQNSNISVADQPPQPQGGYLLSVKGLDEDWLALAHKVLRSVGARPTSDEQTEGHEANHRPLFERRMSVSHHKY